MAIEQQRRKRRRNGLANYRLVRYADDSVVLVTGEEEHAQALRETGASVLTPMGLGLSPGKTGVVHIDEGFDFLGINIRRMRKRGSHKDFVYTLPSRKAITSITDWVWTMRYRHTLHQDAGYLMEYLGRVLRGWANYFRHGVSKAIFNAVDSYTWERITSWLREKHRIGRPELRRRFCLPGTWRLAHDGKRLRGAASVTVMRYRYRGYRIPIPWTRSARAGLSFVRCFLVQAGAMSTTSTSRHQVLTDEQWERVEPLLPSNEGRKGHPFREVMIYRARTGIPWRDLPRAAFGPW